MLKFMQTMFRVAAVFIIISSALQLVHWVDFRGFTREHGYEVQIELNTSKVVNDVSSVWQWTVDLFELMIEDKNARLRPECHNRLAND